MLTSEQRIEKLKTVFRVASGNFLEMYDFMTFGYFGAAVGTVWTPHFDSDLMRKFQISVDCYNIKIDNAVGSLSLTDILPRCFNSDGVSNPNFSAANIYSQQITRNRSTGDIVLGHEGLLNLASYKTDGVDTEIDWSFGPTAKGGAGVNRC